MFVLDDDPTGTQTVRDVPVVVDPSVDALAGLIERRAPVAFILTNSRSLPPDGAAAVATSLARRIARASRRLGRPVSVVSRSDSTLRGHFPGEVDPLIEALGWGEAPILLMPFLGEAGRLTIGDIHYVVSDDVPVPVADTEYARDPAFGFAESDLRRWVAERPGTANRSVVSLSLPLIRTGGPAAVAEALTALPPAAICIANAADDRDAEVVAAAVVEVERAGGHILPRTAAGFVRARAGQPRHPDLEPGELELGDGPGLVVVGSHVPATTRQLQRFLADPPLPVELVEVSAEIAGNAASAPALRRHVARRVAEVLRSGVTPVVATSRTRLASAADDRSGLSLAGRISATLVASVRSLPRRPAWILAKGGITSSDIATEALGSRSAVVVGQLLPGVPVWRVDGGRYPGLVLVVFPGNVGSDDALRRAVAALAGRRSP